MSLPDWLAAALPAATAQAWERLAPVVPSEAYLVGGTAIAVHLAHRESRDLDFFSSAPFDPEALEANLNRHGRFARTMLAEGTLNGVFEDARVQFLDASGQTMLEPVSDVAGLRVAGLGDLLATKLKVIAERGELRDYFDVECIERAGRRAEEGLGLFVARYRPTDPDAAVAAVVRALGWFDVADDPFLPATREDIESYWRARQPEILAHLDRHGLAVPSQAPADEHALDDALSPTRHPSRRKRQ